MGFFLENSGTNLISIGDYGLKKLIFYFQVR